MRIRRLGAHLLTLAAIGGFAILGAASSGSGDGDQADEEGSGNGAGQAARSALERHLTNGQAYGEGPGGAAIAQAMELQLDDAMGDAVAVHVTPGTPEQIVVILRLRDLRDMDDATRGEWLDSFGETVREGFGAIDSNVVVGIRGSVFFGAVATLSPGAVNWDVETGTIVSTNALDDAMAVVATPSQDGQVHQDVYGSIAAADTTFTPPMQDEWQPESRPADRYTLVLAAGAQVSARMHAPEFDCYLYVLGPDQALLTEDDDSGGDLNSLVNFTAAAAGTYTIVAAPYSPEETGNYVLRVRAAGAPAAPTPAAPAPAAPAPAAPAPAAP